MRKNPFYGYKMEQDETVAEYLGKDKGTVSYHNQKFAKMFREMLSFKDTKPEKEL
jgi:hypothetical protein